MHGETKKFLTMVSCIRSHSHWTTNYPLITLYLLEHEVSEAQCFRNGKGPGKCEW